MDGLREEMLEDIYGIEHSCSGCLCETCLDVECYRNCCSGFPCHVRSCDDYIDFKKE